MIEKDIQEQIKKDAKDKGFFVYRPNDRITSGVPDLFLGKETGEGMWIEVKYHDSDYLDSVTLSHPLSAPQSLFLRKVGGIVVIGFNDGSYGYSEDIKPGENRVFEGLKKGLKY